MSYQRDPCRHLDRNCTDLVQNPVVVLLSYTDKLTVIQQGLHRPLVIHLIQGWGNPKTKPNHLKIFYGLSFLYKSVKIINGLETRLGHDFVINSQF